MNNCADFTKWIYPINKSFREYQFNISQGCLYRNTLVCLPTGLGKTQIAATVMLNYYNWFETKKIIFMAPTKPLVKQQFDAIYKTIGISLESTVVLTGNSSNSKERLDLYKSKRVIYATPQIIENDLKNKILEKSEICLLIVDEAHRSTGNYSYCQVIKELVRKIIKKGRQL